MVIVRGTVKEPAWRVVLWCICWVVVAVGGYIAGEGLAIALLGTPIFGTLTVPPAAQAQDITTLGWFIFSFGVVLAIGVGGVILVILNRGR